MPVSDNTYLYVKLTPEQKVELQKKVERLGFSTMSEFIRFIIEADIQINVTLHTSTGVLVTQGEKGES